MWTPQVPPGVFNVVTSPREYAKEIGLELCTSPKARHTPPCLWHMHTYNFYDERYMYTYVPPHTHPPVFLSLLPPLQQVRKVSFTGSTAVGKVLMRDCASTVKKISLELGGNAPVLIFDDADLENAVNGVMAGTCMYNNVYLGR